GTLTFSGDNSSSTGALSINAGALSVANTNALGGGAITFGGGSLVTTANLSYSDGITISGSSAASINPATSTTATFSGAFTGGGTSSIANNGAGTLSLSGLDSNFTGSLVANSGTLQLSIT